MAQVTAPTPTEVAANRWLEYERSWERRIKESDERQRADMRKRIQRDEQAAKELKERQEKQADYKRRELMLTRLMAGKWNSMMTVTRITA
jgi:exonuclease VII large subunit